MVNMGLIYKQQNGIQDAKKMFKAAKDADRRNIGAIINLGCIEFEQGNYDEASISFLDALEIKPDDEEALCNLALSLKKTNYIEYAQIAFEEAVNVSPGNTFILTNYMMFLLEQKYFEQFDKVLPHARRIMDKNELDIVVKLHEEFKTVVDGTAGVLDEAMLGRPDNKMESSLKSALKTVLARRMTLRLSQVEEEGSFA